MNKKAMSGAMLAIIIGAIFIVIVVVGPFSDMVKYVREKFFSGILTPKQQETVVGIPGAKAGPSTVPIIMLSGNKEEAIKQLVKETLLCWKDFERSGFTDQTCKKFEIPPTASWTIAESEYKAVLAVSGEKELGKDLAGIGALNPQNYFWNIFTLNGREKPFWLCGDDDGTPNMVGFTRDPDGGDCH